ncbi:hypothetical protein LPB136_11030 [Tenacibaculum todarodis]|uniref:Lipoprotein n=1 Tax=Tenacibaculum todarodis TaxID=1850252 RepID=A0A1L3JL45_9FLAO|nr:hypothetical protein [Tenacibaculum todarodis]APG65865.1 hypothetical protein LPB136_11030 [Tenacibaculum todarodis]
MNEKLDLGLKALNVNKIIVFFLITFIISCVTKRPDIVNKTYKLRKYKSKSGFTKIVINAYDNETLELIPANVEINDLFFKIKYENNKFIPLEIITNPNSQLNIEVSSIMRHTVNINSFIIKKSDSIIINTYLKKDNRPLH